MNDTPLIAKHPSERTPYSRKVFANNSRGSDAYTRHQRLISNYLYYYGGSVPEPRRARTERAILEETHKFIREESSIADSDYERRFAKDYYDHLFKEFALCDLSKWKEGKVALRWRIQSEVVDGKGQFICGSLRCDRQEDLSSYEVNFAYVEDDVKKNALVKVRLCRKCAKKLGKGKRVRDELDSDERDERRHSREEQHIRTAEASRRRRSQSPSPPKDRNRSRDGRKHHE